MTETETELLPNTGEALAFPEYMRPSLYDSTLEGYLELLTDLLATERAINLDFRSEMLGDKQALHSAVAARLDEINAGLETPIQPDAVNDRFLVGLVQPNWSEHFPPAGSGDEGEKEWELFKSGFSDGIQLNLDEMRILHTKVEQLQSNDALQSEFSDYKSERFDILRAAATWRISERKQSRLSKEIADLRVKASVTKRPLTVAERRTISNKTAQIIELDQERGRLIDSSEKSRQVQDELYRAEARDQKRQLDKGLLVNEPMQRIITEALPSIARGEPCLFVGETGGAKTALAKYLATEYFGVMPEVVSGYGDVNSYQIIGKSGLNVKDGASISEFVSGPVVRAMERGVPLILDEINAMPSELLKRFNEIARLRPGDTFTIQEDSGKEIIIQPGFVILATANEKSKRYKAVDDLSVEFQNRFGSNIYRVRYPDSDATYSDEPVENLILARAAIVDDDGNYPIDIDIDDLYNFVRAARVSQQIFSGEHGEGYRDFIGSDQIRDGKPGLEDTVLAPRTMIDILHKVKGSYGQLSIDEALTRFTDGIKNSNDRMVMTSILRGHGFLKPKQSKSGDGDEILS